MSDGIEYVCHGYNEALPKGKASGTLRVGMSGFEFSIGDQQGKIPFEGAELKLGGASDRLVFISHPLLKNWTVYTSDRSILNHPRLKAHPKLTGQVGRAKALRRWNWLLLLACVAIIFAIPAILIWRTDLWSGYLARQIPVEWETKIGKTAMAQYRFSHTFLPQAQTDALLLPLVKPLQQRLKGSRYPYHFEIVNDPTPNAFALPGGYVVIHSGLIVDANNAEELLGVLAHEITHVEQQHGLQNLITSSGAYLAASAVFGDASGLLAVMANTAPLLLTQSYSRRFEEEADTKGFRLLQDAHINPRGLATFFTRLQAEEKKQLEKIENKQTRDVVTTGARFLSTHPATEKRIRYLKELEAQDQQKNYGDFSHEFTQLQQAVKRYVAENKLQGGAS